MVFYNFPERGFLAFFIFDLRGSKAMMVGLLNAQRKDESLTNRRAANGSIHGGGF